MPELSPTGLAAVYYAEHGLGVIPLQPHGKVPATKHGCKDWSDEPSCLAEHFAAHPDHNVGICTGVLEVPEGEAGAAPETAIIVIDLDCKDNADGVQTLAEWQSTHGALPETVQQSTPTGGRHMVYRTDKKLHGYANPDRGVDLRAQGGYIVVDPSIHPNGGTYEWTCSFDDMAPAVATDVVYAFIDAMRPAQNTVSIGANGGASTWDRFALPDVVAQGSRDETMYKLACSMRAKSVPRDEAEQMCLAANQERFAPPMSEREVLQKIASAYKHPEGKSPAFRVVQGGAVQAATVTDGSLAMEVQRPSTLPERHGKITDETVDEDLKILLAHPQLSSGLKENRQDKKVWVVSPCIRDVPFHGPHPITDGEMYKAFAMLEHDAGIRRFEKFRMALMAFGSHEGKSFDPWMDYLQSVLPIVEPGESGMLRYSFDGGQTWEEHYPIRGKFFNYYMGVKITEYTDGVEKLLNRQLVARALHPGCKADCMVVLYGKQGIGKSQIVRLIGLDDRFYGEGMTDFKQEDTRKIIPKTVVEVAELANMGHKNIEQVKNFITRRIDSDRRPYAIDSTDYPRRCLFIGTTNNITFLYDETGERRFLPLDSDLPENQCNEEIYEEGARRDVLKWWAEGFYEYSQLGKEEFMKLVPLPKWLQEAAKQVQLQHSEEDYTLATIQEWLERHSHQYPRVNVKLVMLECMGFDEKSYHLTKSYEKTAVRTALDKCPGWTRLPKKQNIRGYGTSLTWEVNDQCE